MPRPNGRVVGVAVDHLDVGGRDADLLGDDLGERRLVPLALRLHREPDDGLAGGVDAQLASVGHAETQDVHVLARPRTHRLGEEGDADAHQLAPLSTLRLLPTELVVTGHLHRQAHGGLVLAGVVDPSGLGRVRELLGLDEVADAQLGRVHPELVGQAVDDALDEVHGLRDAEGAGVRHAARSLVGVDGRHLAIGRLEVVAPGEDAEEPGGVLDRRRGAVEGAVVGEHVGPDGEDLALPRGRDLAAHDVVTCEPRADQVLRPVLHPLDRLVQDERRHDGADVPRIDGDLVAEAAADVRRDHPDLVLRQARHEGVDRAVRVRCLRRRPEGQLAVHAVVVGDAAAGLHRRRVHPGIDDVLGDDDGSRLEHGRRGRLVAGLPVEAEVVRLTLQVVADHRGARVERGSGIDDRLQDLVLDIDQLQRVARRVAVLGNDEGHLLTLEADLVGGEHGLDVVGERGHPGQTLLGQVRPRHHGLDLRMRQGRAACRCSRSSRGPPGSAVWPCAACRVAAGRRSSGPCPG